MKLVMTTSIHIENFFKNIFLKENLRRTPRGYSRIFLKFRKCSRCSRKFLKFRKCSRCSRIFEKDLEGSRIFWKITEGSRWPFYHLGYFRLSGTKNGQVFRVFRDFMIPS